jgi:hypothetical protein
MGMTFKTLPFIIWNKVYHSRGIGKTPAPKELFSENLFKIMGLLYITGFILFGVGILIPNDLLLKAGALILLISAFLYLSNVVKTVCHRVKA